MALAAATHICWFFDNKFLGLLSLLVFLIPITFSSPPANGLDGLSQIERVVLHVTTDCFICCVKDLVMGDISNQPIFLSIIGNIDKISLSKF